MHIVHTIKEVRAQIKLWRNEGLSVGYIPTMGFLHEGHASLIKKASEENDRVVVSIFVNPIQFGPNEDFEKYPRDLKRDSYICSSNGAHLIFAPEPSEMYVQNNSTFVDVENITEGLCGAKRPGHFKGVCTVVSKFFNIISPDRAYFGEKDAQQLAVIRKMVIDLNFNIEIVGCPIVREPDGLALSSRNTYLSAEERKAALILNKSLKLAKASLEAGEKNPSEIKRTIIDELSKEPLAKIDYVEVVDSLSLKPIDSINNKILVAIAVYIGKTRLIDNFSF
ncbi:pantoate--beta-alanine ligase [Clostridium omnivorum]|uniref:Pantothenate synthetase n=1 Tax=Clostridium omnivorum TaxID=1604902 RepID=A0ABQ5N1P3_9CLOT|nr:pantoate--beta-alanine ligase [Clostridium sp. E14]GLC29117.1 pantothenate synthetase [Clostridium sp. E14]